MAARVIAWKELNSNLSTESKAAPVYICPLHELLGSGIRLSMVYGNRAQPLRGLTFLGLRQDTLGSLDLCR